MRTIIRLFLTICSVFAFTCSAQNVSKSDVTFSDSILKAAEQGIAEAQYRLGYCYEYGKGVEKSLTEAVKWYRKAADNGYPNAKYVLGNCYKYGKGVEKSLTEAVKWYHKAANDGDIAGQLALGNCYKYGKGVEQSFTEAAKWFRKGATQGYDYAQYELGKCYRDGKGVQQSYKEAEKWFRKAADQGFSLAQKLLKDKVDTKAFFTYKSGIDTITIEETFFVTKKFKEGKREVTKRVVGQDTTIIKDTITYYNTDIDPDSFMDSL